MSAPPFASVEAVIDGLRGAGYIADEALATSVFLAAHLEKPMLCEGPAGVGKTELAKALAAALDTKLVRLQCYEGLDETKTLYEWKYPKQLLYTQLLREKIDDVVRGAGTIADAIERIAAQDDAFFSERFLEARPLLQAVRAERQVVLLIDEVDRAEEELEAFFLEVLAEFQVTVPELGTLVARHRPLVLLTSNSTRELSDAMRRRCVYLPMDYPSPAREAEIIEMRLPGLRSDLARQVAQFVAGLRELDLKKSPSISETLDWARALVVLCAEGLEPQVVTQTLNLLLKYDGDLEIASKQVERLVGTSVTCPPRHVP